MDDDLMAALGVQVVEVDGLAREGCWVVSVRVLLLRAGLDDETRDKVIDWAMLAACGAESD